MIIPRGIDTDFLDRFFFEHHETYHTMRDNFIKDYLLDKYREAREHPETFTHRDYVALQHLVKALSVEAPDYSLIRNTLAKYCLDSGEVERVQKLNGMF